MVLLLGGTIDARLLAEKMTRENIPFLLTAVSEYGKILGEQVSREVHQEMLDKEGMETLIARRGVTLLVDATHPFAQAVSENAIKAAEASGIQYIRYERPGLFSLPSAREAGNLKLQNITGETNSLDRGDVFVVNSHEEASRCAMEVGSSILLTVGSRGLFAYEELIRRKNVYVRVLPEISSLQACQDAGVLPSHIIAMQGPFTREFNALVIREKKIDLLITKDSGKSGGLDEKIIAAREAKIPLLVIRKPGLNYPKMVSDPEALFLTIKEVIQ